MAQLDGDTGKQQEQAVAGCSRNHGERPGSKGAATEEVVRSQGQRGAERQEATGTEQGREISSPKHDGGDASEGDEQTGRALPTEPLPQQERAEQRGEDRGAALDDESGSGGAGEAESNVLAEVDEEHAGQAEEEGKSTGGRACTGAD
jgi:hypothetical protein